MTKPTGAGKRAGEKLPESGPSKKPRSSAALKNGSGGQKPTSKAASTRSSAQDNFVVIDLSEEAELEVVTKKCPLGGKVFPRFREGDVLVKLSEEVKHTYRLHSATLARASSSFQEMLGMAVEELDDEAVRSFLGRGGARFRFELRLSEGCRMGFLIRSTLTEYKGHGVKLPAPVPVARQLGKIYNTQFNSNPEVVGSRGLAGQFDGGDEDRELEGASNELTVQSQDSNKLSLARAIPPSDTNNDHGRPGELKIKTEDEDAEKATQAALTTGTRPFSTSLLAESVLQDTYVDPGRPTGDVPALARKSELDTEDGPILKLENGQQPGLDDAAEESELSSSKIAGSIDAVKIENAVDSISPKNHDLPSTNDRSDTFKAASTTEDAVKTEDDIESRSAEDPRPTKETGKAGDAVKTEDDLDSKPAEDTRPVEVAGKPDVALNDEVDVDSKSESDLSSVDISLLEPITEVEDVVAELIPMEGITASEIEVGLCSIASELTIPKANIEMSDVSVSSPGQPGDFPENPVIHEDSTKLQVEDVIVDSKPMEGIAVSGTWVGLGFTASEPTIQKADNVIDLSVSSDSQHGEIDLPGNPAKGEELRKLQVLEDKSTPLERSTSTSIPSCSSQTDMKGMASVEETLNETTKPPQNEDASWGDLHRQRTRKGKSNKQVAVDPVATTQRIAPMPTQSTKTQDFNSRRQHPDDRRLTGEQYYQLTIIPKYDEPEKVERTEHKEPKTSTPVIPKPVGPSEDLLEAYHNLFLIYYSKEPIINATDIEIALGQVELLLTVAAILNSLLVARPYIVNAIMSFGRELYRAIARDPVRWVTLSNMIASPTIFTEGIIHIVGTYAHQSSALSQIEELGADVLAMIKKKSDELHALRKEVDRALFMTSIRIDGKEVYLDKDNENTRNTWFVVQVFRDWFTRSLGKAKYDENKTEFALEGVYRIIAKGGDAYLPLENVLELLEAFRHPNPSNSHLVHFDVQEVAKDLKIMKDFAQEIVKPLCINNSMLDVEAEGIGYFTCAEVKLQELPQRDALDLDKA